MNVKIIYDTKRSSIYRRKKEEEEGKGLIYIH